MKSIHTLIPDIYDLLGRKDGWFTDDLRQTLAKEVSDRIKAQYDTSETTPRLRLSQMGPRCPKALWSSIHTPELAEPLPPWATFKYTYGHIIEALAITLAKASGHTVEGEQETIHVDGVAGHRDCIIDGCIVDVKSTSSIGFKKFKDRTIAEDDSFGYLDQLDGYVVGSLDDPRLLVKDRAYLFAIDKQLGRMCLYEHVTRPDRIRKRVAEVKSIVGNDHPPRCECGTVADGKSGNIRLDTKASYSAYKHSCFPTLRTFLYADGPRYLTHVERKPDVPEIDKSGNIVYN